MILEGETHISHILHSTKIADIILELMEKQARVTLENKSHRLLVAISASTPVTFTNNICGNWHVVL